MASSLLNRFVDMTTSRQLIIDSRVEERYSKTKKNTAIEIAKQIIEDLPNTKDAIITTAKGYNLHFNQDNELILGTGINGDSRQIALVISFLGDSPIYKLKALHNLHYAL